MSKKSDAYEDVTRKIFVNLRQQLGIANVSTEKVALETASGAGFVADATAFRNGSEILVLIENKRYPKDKVEVGDMRAFAYAIKDAGGEGLMVTPLGYEAGAKAVADFEKIGMATLNVDATEHEYVLKVAENLFRGVHVTDSVSCTDSASVEIKHRGDDDLHSHLSLDG